MNAIMTSAFALLSVAGLFGFTPQETKKAMDECCKTKTADSCSTKADNCCEKKMDGCCQTMKDECCTWTSVYDGKRTSIKHHCVQDPKAANTVRIDVKPEDRRPGDIEGWKTVGKRSERTYYRDVEPAPVTANSDCGSKDGCNYSFTTVGKHPERRSFCEHNGQRVTCGDKAGECATCVK
jgi:hypothetical protein